MPGSANKDTAFADGGVYTSPHTVRTMLDSVGYRPEADLADICAVEPSCGDGAFVAEMSVRLAESAARHDALDAEHLQGCIHATDIDPVAVASCRSKVAYALTSSGMPGTEAGRLAERWVTVGDYLSAPRRQADLVIGNPPYIRASRIPMEKRRHYSSLFASATMGTDLYIPFIEKGMSDLRPGGRLCFICADRWLQNAYGRRLRKLIATRYTLESVSRLDGAGVFQRDVSAYPAIIVISASKPPERGFFRYEERKSEERSAASYLALPHDDAPLALGPTEEVAFVKNASKRFPTIESTGIRIGIGLATGRDSVFVTEDPELVEHDRLLPLFYMRDARNGIPQHRMLVNPWDADGSLVELGSYPRLASYLHAHEEELKNRRVARDHPEQWYRTLDKPNPELLGRPVLLMPDMAAHADPILSDGSRYPHHNCYWLSSEQWDLEALGGLLMSRFASAFVDLYGVHMRGNTKRFQAQYLRMVHIPAYEDVTPTVAEGLASAFRDKDIEKANSWASAAYGL